MSVVNQRSQHKSITNSQVFFVTIFVCYFLLVNDPFVYWEHCLFSQDDGSFQLQGRCVRRCTTPPALPNSTAVYNNTLAQTGATSAGDSECFFGGLKHIETMKMLRDARFKRIIYISWESKIRRQITHNLICGTP